MTKHWPEQTLFAQPALSHLGEHHSHQLDFHRNAQQSFPARGVARNSAVQQWPPHLAQMVPQQLSRVEKPTAGHEHLTSATAFMDSVALAGSSCQSPQDAHFTQETISGDSWNSEREKCSSSGGKKKNYQRYPKPPYSYLAMIAMVIQRTPEKKLTLSEVRIREHCMCLSNQWKAIWLEVVFYARCVLISAVYHLNASQMKYSTVYFRRHTI